jgi:hypothetical protein
MPEPDYYERLALKPSCTQREIKAAFRALAKELHPDTGSGSASAMRELIEAYDVLSDPSARRDYDFRNKSRFERFSFDYRSFLKESHNDPRSMALLVFFDLFHSMEDEALDNWDRMRRIAPFSLYAHLDREDAMDVSFILAEELEARGRSIEAFGVYRDLVYKERERPYFRHFLAEVEDRLMAIARKGQGKSGDGEYLRLLEDLIALALGPRETAWCLQRASRIYARNGRRSEAVIYSERAKSLQRSPSGYGGSGGNGPGPQDGGAQRVD